MNWTKPSTRNTPNNDRAKYDMNQALMMQNNSSPSLSKHQRSSSKQLASSSSKSKAKSKANETKTKVHESLHGLEIAEDFASKHQYKEAQSAYTKHLGTLIQILNEMKMDSSLSSKIGVSQEVLKERTQAALTDAELVKEQLKTMSNVETKKASSKPTSSRPKNSTFHLFFGKSKSTKEVSSSKVDTMIIPTSKSAESNNYTSYQTVTNSTKMTTTKALSREKKKSTSKTTTTTTTSSKQQKPKRKSNLNYNTNDPFITTIKNDMYIDSSTLTTSWNDIAGLVTAKRSLQEAAILPLLRPDLYTGLRAPPKGILLYGPPGTGKTMLVRATAHESQCILFACSASSMTSKWVGEGEKLVRTLFRMAYDVAPSIIFLDEIDSLLGKRKSGEGDGGNESESSRRFKTEFMIQMDGIAAGKGDDDTKDDQTRKLLLIGATNCPWDIDDAIMRRFQRRIYVPLPDKESRFHLWNDMVSKSKKGSKNSGGNIQVSNKEVNELVRLSEGFSCSDITSVANEASFYPLRDLGDIEAIKGVKTADVRPIMFKDFKKAIVSSKKSVSKGLLDRYSQWEEAQSTR